jgi:hypothetical protein
MPKSLSVGDRRLRLSVLFACGVEVAFIVFLTVCLSTPIRSETGWKWWELALHSC